MNDMKNNIERGEELYDEFVKKLLPFMRVCTPRTNSLETFAVLEEKKRIAELVAAMCLELSSEFETGFYIENGELYKKVEVSVKYEK